MTRPFTSADIPLMLTLWHGSAACRDVALEMADASLATASPYLRGDRLVEERIVRADESRLAGRTRT